MWIDTYMPACMHACIHTYTHTHIFERVCYTKGLNISSLSWAYVYVYIYICIQAYVHAHTHACVSARMCTCATKALPYVFLQEESYVCLHVCMHLYVRVTHA